MSHETFLTILENNIQNYTNTNKEVLWNAWKDVSKRLRFQSSKFSLYSHSLASLNETSCEAVNKSLWMYRGFSVQKMKDEMGEEHLE